MPVKKLHFRFSKPAELAPMIIPSSMEPSTRKLGGQKGHNGATLKKFSDPDVIEKIPVDRKTLPKWDYKDVGYESRQIVDIDIALVGHFGFEVTHHFPTCIKSDH